MYLDPTVLSKYFITGPPARSVGGQYFLLAGICRRRMSLSSSVTLHLWEYESGMLCALLRHETRSWCCWRRHHIL